MIKLLADASLPQLEILLDESFHITRYHDTQELCDNLAGQDILLCRSNIRINSELLAKSNFRCVATASSGVDHIDAEYLHRNHITLLDAKGSNARSVADYVTACIAYLQVSLDWKGCMAGVIGMGEVGSKVKDRLQILGYKVKVYDPLRAERDSSFISDELEEVMQSDVLCVHPHLHDGPLFPSRHMVNAMFLAQIKPYSVIINAARGDVIEESSLITKRSILYCTDVYTDEPHISRDIVDYATLCTPHIAGHSIEARSAMVGDVCHKINQWAGLKPQMVGFPSRTADVVLYKKATWQETVLSIYNPILETDRLKQSNNLTETFITLRQAHRQRHDFSWYIGNSEDAWLHALFDSK